MRGTIRDCKLEGKKLVGTYTTFDKYHKVRTVSRCELFWRQDAFPDPPQ